MANSAAGEASDYNTGIINEFRANQGRVGGPWAGITLILIHHIGARSGIERVTPVAYHPQPGGRFAIWAANEGAPTHPNWYYNLKAHLRITAEVGAQTFTVLAEELGGTARAELWLKLVSAYPPARRSPGQDHAAVSAVRTDPPGLTRDENPACAMTVLRGSRPQTFSRAQCAHAAWREGHPRLMLQALARPRRACQDYWHDQHNAHQMKRIERGGGTRVTR